MAFNFANVTDDARVGMPGNFYNNDSLTVFAGWFRPTTLTAGRYLIGMQATTSTGVSIDATTDELKCVSRGVTTNGEWVTTGVDMVVDEWMFMACAIQPADAMGGTPWRLWCANKDRRPVMFTPALSVAQVGANTSGGNVAIGNSDTTASNGFQGQIAECTFGNITSTVNHDWRLATSGAWTAREEERIFQQFVIPAYLHDMGALWDTFKSHGQHAGEIYHLCCTHDGEIAHGRRLHTNNGESRVNVSLFGPTVDNTQRPPSGNRSHFGGGRRKVRTL